MKTGAAELGRDAQDLTSDFTSGAQTRALPSASSGGAGYRAEREDELVGASAEIEHALKTLRRNLSIILLAALVGFTAAYFAIDSRGPTYEAESTVLLETGPSTASQILEVLGRLELSRSMIATQVDIMESRGVLGDVADRLSLVEDPRYNPALREPSMFSVGGLRDAITSLIGAATPRAAMPEAAQREAVVNRLDSQIQIRREGDSLALAVVAEASDPETAAAIANMVTTVYLEKLSRERRAEIETAVRILRERATTLTEKISTLEQRLALQIREARLDDAQYDERLRGEIAQLAARAAIAPDSTPEERALKERLLAETQRVEEQLRARTLAEVQRGQIERELETDRSRYQFVVERLSTLDTETEALRSSARLLSSAEPPTEPSGFSALTAGLMGAVGFSVVSVIGVFVVAAIDTRIREPEQIETALGAPCFTSVPELRSRRSIGNAAASSPHERMRSRPQSGFSEAVRRLFLQVASSVNSPDCNIVAVTSSLPNEGKSTMSLCLAVAARPRYRRIALVDLDLRRHGLASMLMASAGVDERTSRRDLRAWFEGRVELEQVACTFDALPGIDVFPAMYVEGDLSAVLTSDNLELLFDYLRENYDFVIVDTPPALPVSDIELVAPCADGLLVVVGWEAVTYGALREMGKILEHINAPLMGAVLNRVNTRKQWRSGGARIADYYKYYDAEA